MNHYYLENSQFLEVCSDIAEFVLVETWPENPYQTEQNGDQRLTDQAQENFNGFIDTVEAILKQNGIHRD